MDFSLQLLPEQPLAELIQVVRVADELGFRGCYSADATYHKDLWVLLGAAAPMTRRLRFGPEVTHVILRDPTLIAQQAATLDELTGGRAEIVFAIGNLAMLDQYEVAWRSSRPLALSAKRTRSCAGSSPTGASTSRASSTGTRACSPSPGRYSNRRRSSSGR
jgi:5,10-methylenetetrahydromethanopterin reductase